jgi:hypothetical protein
MKRSQWVALLVLALAVPALAAQTVPYLPVPKGAAVILNSGSTNSAGYRIVVQRSGDAEYVLGGTQTFGKIPSALAATFFDDLGKAMPLSAIDVAPCMKSASFGYSLFVWWHGQRSPDITCPGAAALASDAAAVASALGIRAMMNGGHLIPPLPNEPRMPLPSPTQ